MSAGRVVVVAGAGDVGGRLAGLRAAAGDSVLALRRRDAPMPAGVRALRADLGDGQGLSALPRRPDAVVFCAAPDSRDEAAYRRLYVDGQRRLLDALAEVPAHWVFVSSTAVYGEDDGSWVDEETPARPTGFNGRVLLDAEAVAGCAAIALRLTGLYGPGRDAMRRRALTVEAARPHWTNRIHVDDAAAAASHLLDLAAPPRCCLGVDDLPARECDVFDWLRARAGLPAAPRVDVPESGRRASNRRLRALGWAPRHPDFRSGYAALGW